MLHVAIGLKIEVEKGSLSTEVEQRLVDLKKVGFGYAFEKEAGKNSCT